MKVLIIGASGFVGSSFMKRYADDSSIELWGCGRRPMPLKNYFQIDLANEFQQLPIIPDVIIHCAARSSPWGTAEEFYRANVNATVNVIKFCQNHGVKKLIYISSSSVFYENKDQFNITETTAIPFTFVNYYAETKHIGEKCVRDRIKNHIILRPRAVYGEGDTVLFPRIIEAAKRGKLPKIKGKQVYGDLISIDNLCHYMYQAIKTDVTGDFNLTDGKPVEIHAFLSSILERLGLPVKYVSVPMGVAMAFAGATELFYRYFNSKSEPPITRFGVGVFGYSKTFDTTKAISTFGEPKATTAESVEKFIQWQLKR